MLRILPLAAVLCLAALPRARPDNPTGDLPPAAFNENRTAAGRLSGGTLTLALEIRQSIWHLLGDDQPGASILAFAEVGKGPQMPGPLVRVPLGTRLEVAVTNTHDSTIVVHGLSARRQPVMDSLVVAPGTTATARFIADVEGTFYYWAAKAGTGFKDRMYEDSQLHGAFVVDPPGGQVAPDRVFVIGAWVSAQDEKGEPDFDNEYMVINGRPWPHTERLAYAQGDSVRWRIVNASPAPHPLHLHGFYYRVDARGDAQRDTVYWAAQQRMVVTDLVDAGQTMRLAFLPDRAGGWVFHCHLNWHVVRNPGLGKARAQKDMRLKELLDTHGDHDPSRHVELGMGGLMLGIEIQPKGAPAPNAAGRRVMRLFVQSDSVPGDSLPRFGFVLQEGGREPAPDSVRLPGSTIVLHRGEPTSLWVINRSNEPTAVHWHGLELESPFDGVVGVGGYRGSPTPAIMPGDSFEVRVTPPRSGSFMYHTHVNDTRQQRLGLWGPLLVVEPGAEWNPELDRVFIVGEGEDFEPRLNGRGPPRPIELATKTPYRFRLMNVTMGGPKLQATLVRNGGPLQWRPVAKDGHDLPAWQRQPVVARQQVSIGETFDYEVSFNRPGDVALEIRRANGSLVVAQPIIVVAPPEQKSP
ncbi:MAG: multicopper oxidase domain-containing protein [Gemmatimonadales bacterium]